MYNFHDCFATAASRPTSLSLKGTVPWDWDGLYDAHTKRPITERPTLKTSYHQTSHSQNVPQLKTSHSCNGQWGGCVRGSNQLRDQERGVTHTLQRRGPTKVQGRGANGTAATPSLRSATIQRCCQSMKSRSTLSKSMTSDWGSASTQRSSSRSLLGFRTARGPGRPT